VAIERQARREGARRAKARRYRDAQTRFAEEMQSMTDESAAHDLLKRHLERSLSGAAVVVLNRNQSDDRLLASTGVPKASQLAQRLVDAEPASCLAVRLGREYRQGAGSESQMACGLCGKSAAEITCMPSRVGGAVIGSVLIRADEPLEESERTRIADTVTQAAPALANLRNLSIAETRASTDSLTGLPNTRSCHDNLKRMMSQAGRAVSPLSLVVFDLDYFKQINDRFGHGAGDDVLAAVGQSVPATLRASDFVGRHGGEEFLALLPDTDRDGALKTAEKLRQAIEAIGVPGVEREISASFGVATYPFDAVDGDGLLRIADRALYVAKDAGRNRVEVAGPA
jgi:diguanylate cyclase (GGDEF)-like protein